MSKKTVRSKDADRTPGTTKPADAAVERAKRAARKVVQENIARIEQAERAAALPGVGPAAHSEQPAQPQPDQQQREQPQQMPAPKPGQGAAKKAARAPGAKAAKPAKATTGAKPAKATKPAKVKRLSCIDAAAQIIGKDPIGCKDLIAEMGQRKLWASPNGKTPDASLYAAIIREIAAKKGEARFKKVDRGLFVAGPGAAKKN